MFYRWNHISTSNHLNDLLVKRTATLLYGQFCNDSRCHFCWQSVYCKPILPQYDYVSPVPWVIQAAVLINCVWPELHYCCISTNSFHTDEDTVNRKSEYDWSKWVDTIDISTVCVDVDRRLFSLKFNRSSLMTESRLWGSLGTCICGSSVSSLVEVKVHKQIGLFPWWHTGVLLGFEVPTILQ